MAPKDMTFGVALTMESLVDMAREAEALGYDRVSIGEHVMDGRPPRPTLLGIPALAAAAGATRRIRLLTGIVLIPLYHPVLLAKLASTLDYVSGGRLDFGIGLGGQRDTRVEFEVLGVPAEERGRRANESLQLIKRLWTEENVTFEGRFYACKEVTLLPHPLQKPHPPIWVAGREEPAMRRAARYGDGWYPFLYTLRRLQSSIEKIRQFASQEGRDLSGFRWGVLQPIAIAGDKAEALRVAVAHVGRRYATERMRAEDVAQALCITGTPQDCIREVEARLALGVTDIVFQFQGTPQMVWEQMRQAAQHVLPYFRG
ncbi:Alkanesulfonate monooxygenase [bacterium HR23]|nr:Alkanesulfonate monooxygenase [bacterium HR23]